MKRARAVWAMLSVSLVLASGGHVNAQGPRARLASAIGGSEVSLPGTRPGQAAFGKDQGALPANTALQGITLVLNRTEAQSADLQSLLAAQINPASPLYHQWLTPDQFGTRFGVADADLGKITTWLEGQGFRVEGISRSRDRITFDGTAGQVNGAFHTELRRYAFPDRTHFAPNSDLSVPAALAPLVTTVDRLADFRPHRQVKLAARAKPAYTSSVSPGAHYLTPGDLKTMYDANSLYKAGFNGAGQSVAILGQTYINTAPISAFQSGIGMSADLPTMVLVPNTGVNGINAIADGDAGESQLDVEYASGMAPGATIFFVYTGDNDNAGVFDSLTYAVDENIAPIISGSYGECETELQGAPSDVAAISMVMQQANAQGQTVLFSSGDDGSTDCYGYTDLTAAQQGALVADFPASAPYATAVGGTQMATGTFTAGANQYWQGASGTDVTSSLLSYVPETVWNEDTNPLIETVAAGGGGTSVLYSRPTWQAGVTGIPAGTNRLVPDVAFQSSIDSPGYIYCTDDSSDLDAEDLPDSCSNGLRSSGGYFLTAGGTSFATPAFAGLLAVLNQSTHSTGQGNINPTLYSLAGNATTYASVFHDITTGTNACTLGATVCTTAGASAYAATAGYDEATGLGSLDFGNLVAAWPASNGGAGATALAATTVTIAAATSTPSPGATDVLTITVAPQAGSGTPTGTVAITVDGAAVTPALTLANGSATYTYTAPATGIGGHAVVAAYSGDTTFAASRATAALSVGNATATGSFTIAAPSFTVPTNGLASQNFVLTPAAGYTGTVVITLSYPSTGPTLCYDLTNPNSLGFNVPLTTGAPVTGTLTIGEGTQCTTSASGAKVLRKNGGTAHLENRGGKPGRQPWTAPVVWASLLVAGFAGGRRSRRLPKLLGAGLLLLAGLSVTAGLSGCGGNSGSTVPSPISQTQTVAVTLAGADSVDSSITSSTNLTLTIR